MIVEDLNRLTEHHMTACPLYGDYVRSMFASTPARTPARTLAELPYLPVRAFKEFELRSVPEAEVFKTMRSSGTSGQVSQIFLDRGTAQRQTSALVSIFGDMFGKGRFPMLVIDAESTVRDRLKFSARTAAVNGFSMFSRGRAFALNDDMSLDIGRVRAFCAEHADRPIFVFGFTFLIWSAFVQDLQARGEVLPLQNGFLLHGGGWKKLTAQAVDNPTFKAAIAATTGLTRVHNYYGMVEQTGTIFMECPEGHLHAAPGGDVMIRDPQTHAPLPHGQTGLIQVFSTIQDSYPGHALLTEDVGRTYPGTSCPCGRAGTIVEIDGRLTQAEVRGCSDAYS